MFLPTLTYWCALATFLGLVGLASFLFEEMRATTETEEDRTVRYIFCRYED